jgi:thiol-disulfide isomerase/thioredoxin
MRRKILLAILLLGLAALALAQEVGQPAPPFVNPGLDKRHVWSKNYLGQGWVLLDFFATDCEACKRELPILEELYRDYRDDGFTVLVFATDAEGADVVIPYFEENPTTMQVLLDRYQVAVKKYQVKEIPSLFLINPKGIVVAKEVGYREDIYDHISGFLISGQ